MKDALERIRQEAAEALRAAADLKILDEARVKYLGKKGELTGILKQMGGLSAEERPRIGQLANEIRAALEELIAQRAEALAAGQLTAALAEETLDVTMPGRKQRMGHRHPLNVVLDEAK